MTASFHFLLQEVANYHLVYETTSTASERMSAVKTIMITILIWLFDEMTSIVGGLECCWR